MTNKIIELMQSGWSDEEIGKHLGMDTDEVMQLQQEIKTEKKIEQIVNLIRSLAELPVEKRFTTINAIMKEMQYLHPNPDAVSFVRWVPADMVMANDYNPNNVAPPEMRLLYESIKEDGYTQPIVTYWDREKMKYVVVDGFHRNRVGKEYKDIKERTHDRLPIVTIDRLEQDRMASTIRHNRARGKHSVMGMVYVVVELVQLGWTDEQIGKHLGMDADEVLRLKQTSGIAELFRNREYSRSWIQKEESE